MPECSHIEGLGIVGLRSWHQRLCPPPRHARDGAQVSVCLLTVIKQSSKVASVVKAMRLPHICTAAAAVKSSAKTAMGSFGADKERLYFLAVRLHLLDTPWLRRGPDRRGSFSLDPCPDYRVVVSTLRAFSERAKS